MYIIMLLVHRDNLCYIHTKSNPMCTATEGTALVVVLVLGLLDEL